jgi:hypothetical protein
MSNRKSRRAAEARQRQQLARHATAFAKSPAGSVLNALHESMTTPDKEDWTLPVDGDELYVTAYRDIDDTTQFRGGVGSVKQLQSGLLERMALEQSYCRQMRRDAFLVWIQGMAKKHDFSLMTIMGDVPTSEAIAVWKKQMLSYAESAGEA